MTSRENANRQVPSPSAPQTPRELVRTSDAKLRAITESILAMPVDDRLRQIEAEADFFGSIRQSDA
jgi:hypothetical protein